MRSFSLPGQVNFVKKRNTEGVMILRGKFILRLTDLRKPDKRIRIYLKFHLDFFYKQFAKFSSHKIPLKQNSVIFQHGEILAGT